MAGNPARSGNPALRAAAEDDYDDTPLEAEASEARATFEFADEVYVLRRIPQDFKLPAFIRAAERSQNTDAIEMAIGKDQYERIEDDILSFDDFIEVIELISKALGLDGPGESRASRRSSAKQRRAPR